MQIDCPNCDAQYNISENMTISSNHVQNVTPKPPI